MRRICCIIMLFLCFALQGCEKADYQEYETGAYVNSPESKENEDTPETKFEETKETDKLDAYYGCYQITQFYPTIYYRNVKYDCLPEQEEDMLLGRMVIMEKQRLVTYDSERRLGTTEGRDGFEGNYLITEYTIENPQYACQAITSDAIDLFLKPDQDMKSAIGESFYEQIENIISIPQLCTPYGTQYFYTLSDTDQMILYSTLNHQYFLLERVNQNQEELSPKQLSNAQINQLLEELYGTYEITEFLPTKFYPAQDSSGYVILPQEEADLMIGKEIIIRKDVFTTYDNCRQPNSWIAQRLEDGYWIDKIEIENPEYRVECKNRNDIYGIRDDILPDELEQQEYIEIDVYPGYYRGANTLPQLFLTENGKIIMYAMGEYFLLERNENHINLNIQDLDMIPQCLWGTWVMAEELHGKDGWGECRNEFQGLSVKFTPTGFTFQNDYSEVSAYSCSTIAIADIDGYYREAWQFRELGLVGDYYLKFYPKWDNHEDEIGWYWEYILVSETELIIPEARNGMYKMKKVAEYTEMENELDYLMINPFRSICYGIWEVTEELGEPCQFVDIGYKLGTFGKPGSFDYCRVLDRSEKTVDEIAELIGLSDGNEYLVYCKFSADYFWDYMIIKDGMTAVLVKGECLYQVRRISNPEKDGIYEELG